MGELQSTSSHRRLKELLAISETERTDAQWNEINELEISLTSVNQKLVPEKRDRQKKAVSTGHYPGPPSGWSKSQPRKHHQKSGRR
ncbi:hypothetical protein [Nitrosovibrio sp. Nv6]|uniref:hypothetical protein n=1 Tax=Nitrosovibrio sp. Nv6 TaxID=1855340 RepID=UPI0008B65BD2|nr:hypothetical protein [Nitrosovibrio sp. Nv6]SEP42949.1 hypothetical protein SAMN05216316_3075 [Nitrosovibrio sp. Nv6]